MTKLGELRGSVTVEIDGVEGAGVSTFCVPIAVLEQARQGDALSVAVGTPDGAIRDSVRASAREALDLVLMHIPTAHAQHASTTISTDDSPEGVGGSNP